MPRQEFLKSPRTVMSSPSTSPRRSREPIRTLPQAPPREVAVQLSPAQQQTLLTGLFGPQLAAFKGGGGLGDAHEREADEVAAGLLGKEPQAQPRPVQAARPGAGLQGVHPQIQASIADASGRGEHLPHELQSRFGQGLGADLSNVRVHTDQRADTLNRALNARAFTWGRDVFFRRGQYSPSTSDGQSLLAHELTHVVQQSGGSSPRAATAQTGIQPMIQRYIMQIGKDDSYTQGMAEQLRKEHPNETYLQFRAIWDRFGRIYRPKKIGKDGSRRADLKLAGLASDEPIRIVAHGDGAGKVGGYTGEMMAHLLVELGLPLEHKGGIDVHACMPGSGYSENDGKAKVKKQPLIVQLQDKLAEVDIKEEVRGYEHCIFPGGINNEVPGSAYYLYSEVALAAHAARDDKDWKLTDAHLDIMKKVMGEAERAKFLKANTEDGKKPKHNGMVFYFQLRDWMEEKGLFLKAKLRRAESMRDDKL